MAPFLPLLLSELTVPWYVVSLVDIELVGDSGDIVKVSVSTAEVHALLNRAVIASRSFFKECGVKDADALIRHCVNRVFRGLGFVPGAA